MVNRVLMWGAPAVVASDQLPMASFEASGNNFGNILIGNSVHSYLSENEIIRREDIGSPAEADERCDQVVIPAANFLWRDFDFGYMFDFLDKTSLPVSIIGVGAQTHDRSTVATVHPNTLRLMKLISERSKNLGVRGYYTAEVLAANGIHNVSVIGCPSIYSARRPTIKIDLERMREPHSLSVNFSRRVSRHSFSHERLRLLENNLLKRALQMNSDFVAQDEIDEINLMSGADVDVRSLVQYFDQSDPNAVTEFFKNKTKYFCNVEDWSSYIGRKSFSVGSRFHGNLIALLNGVPAMIFVHDSRTLEMCALMGLPYVHVNEAEGALSTPDGLWERLLGTTYERFESGYAVLYRRFVEFLSSNGLQHNLPN